MADNVAITAGSGTTIASDDIGGGVQAQRVKPVWGADGTGNDVNLATPLPVSAGARSVEVSATPTLDTSAYASGDCLHTTVITFSSAVGTALTGFVEKMVVVDAAVQSQPLELWLFNATVTPAAANAAHSISDADAAKCIGVIYSGPYYASALNSVSVAKGVSLAIKCAASSLFGILVTRGTPTYAAGSLQVSLQISQD